VPTPQQLLWHEAGVGLFFHWAPNVYQGTEGDNRSTPRDQINPDRFNADQWVEAVKIANAGYMIFVAKHVGGYCAWQTTTTDYSLKTSPWKQGKGDMLAELAKACQTAGVRLGVNGAECRWWNSVGQPAFGFRHRLYCSSHVEPRNPGMRGASFGQGLQEVRRVRGAKTHHKVNLSSTAKNPEKVSAVFSS
jgi:hypothetical protein